MMDARELVEYGRWKTASPYAATMLVAPMILLQISLNAFLIGLEIYLGKVYTSRLIPSYGSGSMGILVSFIVSSLFGLAMFYVAQGLKSTDVLWLKHWRKVSHDHQARILRRKRQMSYAQLAQGP
jgi:hypothetical protein